MAINTPQPGPKPQAYDIYARITRTLRALTLRSNQYETELLSVKYDNEQLKRQNRQFADELADLRRMIERKLQPDLSITTYTYALHTADQPAQSEQIPPGDISHEITHELPDPETPENVAGEDEDVTYVHQAIASKAARVTSHHLSREHPVEDLHTALAEHIQNCQKSTEVVISNGVAGCLLMTPLAYLPGVKWRYNGLLSDCEFLCASYEEKNGKGTL